MTGLQTLSEVWEPHETQFSQFFSILLHPVLADKPSATTDKQAADATTLTPEQCVDRLTGLSAPGLLRDTMLKRISQTDPLDRMLQRKAAGIKADDQDAAAALSRYDSDDTDDNLWPWLRQPCAVPPHAYGQWDEGYDSLDEGYGYEYHSKAEISPLSLVALLIAYTGSASDSGVLDPSKVTGLVSFSLTAGSPGQFKNPPVNIPDGPFGIWQAQAIKAVYLRPLPGRPFVFIEGPASQPTRVVVQAQLSPLIYPLEGGATTSYTQAESGTLLATSVYGTVPDFRIHFEELSQQAAYNATYTIEIEYLSLPPASYYSLISPNWRGAVRLEGTITAA